MSFGQGLCSGHHPGRHAEKKKVEFKFEFDHGVITPKLWCMAWPSLDGHLGWLAASSSLG